MSEPNRRQFLQSIAGAVVGTTIPFPVTTGQIQVKEIGGLGHCDPPHFELEGLSLPIIHSDFWYGWVSPQVNCRCTWSPK